MKTKSFRNIFALALILFTVLSCGKYEDGPWISFRSPEKRIEGTWKVKEFWRNNENLTDFYNANFNWDFWMGDANPDDPSIPASRCSQTRYNCVYDSLDTIWATNVQSFWHFQGNDSLFMPIIALPGENPPYCGFYPLIPCVSQFKIKKLTDNKLWLEHTKDGDVYLIKFYKL